MNKYLITINNKKYIKKYKNIGINAFVFALKDYSLGYIKTYSIKEVEKLKLDNAYLLINKLLDSDDIDILKNILSKLSFIKGIIFDDIGLINIIPARIEKIFINSHFSTNYESINFWLNEVDSVLLSNEITTKEIDTILDNSNKSLVVQVFGLNQIMYSRRTLLTNFSKNYKIKNKKLRVISNSNIDFIVMENKLGTIFYNKKIYNGMSLLNKNNIKYYFINTSLLNDISIIKLLKNKENNFICDEGFLDTETIYKVKER